MRQSPGGCRLTRVQTMDPCHQEGGGEEQRAEPALESGEEAPGYFSSDRFSPNTAWTLLSSPCAWLASPSRFS